jgi:hypothetical protein
MFRIAFLLLLRIRRLALEEPKRVHGTPDSSSPILLGKFFLPASMVLGPKSKHLI